MVVSFQVALWAKTHDLCGDNHANYFDTRIQADGCIVRRPRHRVVIVAWDAFAQDRRRIR